MMRSRQDRGGGSNDSGSGHGFPQTEGCNLDTTTLKPCSYAQFATGCKFVPGSKQICSTPKVGANLHPMQCKFSHGCKFLKHRSHGKKYTRGANLHPGANCAYEPSFRELRMEDNSSFLNHMRMEPLMFDEILNRVSHRIQENDTHFRKALEPGLELERIMRSWRERDEILANAAQSPIA